MFKKILVALENSPADETILSYALELGKQNGVELLLVHVADGWVARHFQQFNLAESEEMKNDREYLEKTADELGAKGLAVTTVLALGDPPAEILKAADSEHCELIMMATHGHRFFGDLFHGSTISEVRHKTSMPMFVVRAKKI